MRPARYWLLFTLCIIVLAGVALRVERGEGSIPPVLVVDEGNLRFTYHVLSGTQALFDLRDDPACLRNLTEDMPATTRVLRAHLERKLGVPDLGRLRKPDDRQYRTLRGLGYLR